MTTAPAFERAVAAPLVALLLPLLIISAALSIDIGLVMSSKARLQRALDSAALSAAQALGETQDRATAEANAGRVARQILGANGISTANLASPVSVTFPPDRGNAVTVSATLRSPTTLLRAVSSISEFSVAASATADVNTYAEVPIKPTGTFGKTQQVNPAVFGPMALRSNGDAYSTTYLNGGAANPDQLPYGYLFRIDVPASYRTTYGSNLVIELFDPDSYNDPATYSGCGDKEDPCVILNDIAPGWHTFRRVDELRPAYNASDQSAPCGGSGQPACSTWATTTEYTLWHFDPYITNAFQNPATLSDQSGGAYVARTSYGYTSTTDLKWVTAFTVNVDSFAQERDGGWYFYLYVKSTAGSSENNFDVRTGPPGQTKEPHIDQQLCIGAGNPIPACTGDFRWNSGGTAVYARRAYPMNNAEAAAFTVYLTQVPFNAAGQTLQIRHFDNDASGSTGQVIYYMEQPTGASTYVDVEVARSRLSGNGVWTLSGYTTGPDVVVLPPKDGAIFSAVEQWGKESTWLKAYYPPTISQDTSVWELIYLRPRLIK